MEIYLKKFFVGYLLIGFVIVFAIRFLEGSQYIAIPLFVGLIQLLFYYLDKKYLPKRRAEITGALVDIFQVEPSSKEVLKFRLKAMDFFVKIEIDFKKGLQLANVEKVSFYIPKTQIHRLSLEPELSLTTDKIDGIQTYNIYQTNGSGLKLAKSDIEKMIKN